MPRDELKCFLRQGKIARIDVSKILDGNACVRGQSIKVCFFVEDAPLDQDPVSGNADLARVAFRRGQQRSWKHAAQAIQLDSRPYSARCGWVVARLLKAHTACERGFKTPGRVRQSAETRLRIPAKLPCPPSHGHLTATPRYNGTRIRPRMVYKTRTRNPHMMQPQMVSSFNNRLRNLAFAAASAVWCVASAASPVQAQGAPAVAPQPASPPVIVPQPAAPQAVPGFWDPRRRPDRPDLSRLTVIRFLTETDYPPFNFTGPDGNPAGFNVDLARMICEEIKVACTIQMRRFETLVDAINGNRGDAIIASLAVTPQLRAKLDFSDPYYRAPARFVSRRDAVMAEVRPEYLEGKKVGAIAGSSHEAYLKTLFTDAQLVSFPNDEALRLALRRGEVDFIFGDAISLAFWVNGTDSVDCCAFSGGPFTESRYFGEGVGIGVKRGNDLLRQALNWAMFRLWEKGRYTDLWLRYFSVSPF